MAEMVFKDLKTDEKNEITIGSIEVEVTYPDGRPCAGLPYELKLDKGGTRKGTLDQNGRLHELNVPPGYSSVKQSESTSDFTADEGRTTASEPDELVRIQ